MNIKNPLYVKKSKSDPIAPAENGALGLVQGTYNVGSNNGILLDIQDGTIKEIYFKKGNNYIDSSEMMNLFDSLDEKIFALRSKTGTIAFATEFTVYNREVPVSRGDSIILRPYSLADAEEANRIGLTVDSTFSLINQQYCITLRSNIAASFDIYLCYTTITGRAQAGYVYLCGINETFTPTPPTPTNQVTDEFGNPVTDENNNPVVIL